MADQITGKKITALPENAEAADNDIMLVGNAGTANLRRITFGKIAEKIKEKIASWAFATLATSNKTLPGAINELNSALADANNRIVAETVIRTLTANWTSVHKSGYYLLGIYYVSPGGDSIGIKYVNRGTTAPYPYTIIMEGIQNTNISLHCIWCKE